MATQNVRSYLIPEIFTTFSSEFDMRNHTRNFYFAYVNIEASHERGAIMLKSLKIEYIFESSFVSIARRMQLLSHGLYIHTTASIEKWYIGIFEIMKADQSPVNTNIIYFCEKMTHFLPLILIMILNINLNWLNINLLILINVTTLW